MAGHSGKKHVASDATRSSHEAADRSASVVTRRGTTETRRPWEDEDEDEIPHSTEYIDEEEDNDNKDMSFWKEQALATGSGRLARYADLDFGCQNDEAKGEK